MKKFLCLVLSLALLGTCAPFTAAAAADDGQYGIYTKAELQATKDRLAANDPETTAAFDQFMARVDGWCMARTSHAMADYYIPGYYVDGDGHITASKNLTHDAYAAYAAALAWQLTDEDKYAEKARELLNGWAAVNKTFSLGDDTPLVAAYGGVGLIYGAELITEYTGWTASEQSTFKTWVKNLYKPAITSIVDRPNNWASWGLMASLATNYYLDDQAGVKDIAGRLPGAINGQISSNGSFPGEIDRGTSGMWYTYFSLAPLTQAAHIAYNVTGENYFTYMGSFGATLKKALDNFLPYVQNPDLWDEDYKADKYPDGTLNRPTMSGGNDAAPNWPANMYAAMADLFGDQGAAYGELVADYQPIMGGWTEREAHHLAWCFPSLIQTTPIPMDGSGDTQPASIDEDFESGVLGSYWQIDKIPSNGSTDGLDASVVEDPADASNHALKLTDTRQGGWDSAAGKGTGCIEAVADLQPITGEVQVSFNIKFAGTHTGSASSGMHLQDVANNNASLVSLMLSTSGAMVIRRPTDRPGGSATDYQLTGGPVDLNKWYAIRVLVNTDAQTFDIYVDGELKAENQYFRSADAKSVSRIKFTTDSGANDTMNYIDNVYVNGVKDAAVEGAGISAVRSGDTATIRFASKVTGDGATAAGAAVLPLWIFSTDETSDKAETVSFDHPVANGETFAVDVSGIPASQFGTTIVVKPYIVVNGGQKWADQTAQASVNDIVPTAAE